ncbi:MAG: hypothetical protein HYY06_19890 [Deltaproteobacteria bacterium]|nr:hypothetical protein [Deltaproteobacteria bacterium]
MDSHALARAVRSLVFLPLVACIAEAPEGNEWAASAISDPAVGPAAVWAQTARLGRCGTWSLNENYSTGRFNVHRYQVELPAGGPVEVRFARTAASWEPAVLVRDTAGAQIVADGTAVEHPAVTATVAASGRGSDRAVLTLEAAAPTTVYVYATGWSVIDGGFRTYLPRTSRYSISLAHECPAGNWRTAHVGLDLDGSLIPRAGIANGTLRRTLGVRTEPYGTVVTVDDLELVQGSISWFGGPSDYGVGAYETTAISGERARALNSPMNASAETIASRPEDFYYAAMRFDYSPNGTRWWKNARLLVVNPATQDAIVVRPADWGPNTYTRRIIDLSPQSLEDLGLTTDDEVWVAFALPDTPLGPVR